MDKNAKAWGDLAEKAVRQTLTRMGECIIPAHLIENGGAPKMLGHVKSWTLPDMLGCKNGASRWIEVKFKRAPALFEKIGRYRHGIDIPKWNDYRAVEKESGIPGWIAIVQYQPGDEADPEPCLLMQSFAHLEHVTQFSHKPTSKAPNGMCYWDIDEMDTVCSLDFDFGNQLVLERKIHPWSKKSKAGIAPAADMTTKQRSFFW